MNQVWKTRCTLTTWSVFRSSKFNLRVSAQFVNPHNTCYYFYLSQPTSRYSHSMPSDMEAPAPDSASQLVEHGGKEYRVIREGRACILKPPAETAATQATRRDLRPEDESQTVFYNPIQQFNRDLTVLALRVYGEHVMARNRQKNEKRKSKTQGSAGGRNKKRKLENEGDEEIKEQHSKQDNEVKGAKDESQQTPDTHPKVNSSPPFTILDALSASGLRALRYASEIPFVTRVVANDLSSSAIQSMKLNIEYNQLEKLIQPNNGDARIYMYNCLKPATNPHKKDDIGKFDVIDLDPYGSAAPFIDAAVQGVKDEGLLCITCTDAGVWASNGYPEKSFSLYGGVPMKGTHSHEGGLRLILNSVAISAGKYGLAIEPLLSLSIDFYARLFVRIHRSPAEAKFTSGNTMLVYNCDSGCGAWATQPLTQTKQKLDKKGNPFYHFGFAQAPTASQKCEHCGMKTHLSGPMWAGPLHNPHFIQKVLNLLPQVDRDVYQTIDRVEGMLTTALEEDLGLELSPDEDTSRSPTGSNEEDAPTQIAELTHIIPRADPALRDPHPFYFSLSSISKVLHTTTVSYDAFRGAVRHLGYRCTRSHTKPNTVRTDAPWAIIWEIMREWVRQKQPIKEGSIRPGTAAAGIMAKSRENINRDDPQLTQLRKELVSAVETGKDMSDLITRVQAALYRSESRTLPDKGEDAPGPSLNSTGGTSQQESDPREVRHSDGSPSRQTCSELEVVFDESLGRQTRHKRLVRYQVNPRANWGPLSRASRGS
ncbi:S-adenosyl-L-methionine-dependent methyltransferase [Aspergillus varians]